MNTLRSEFNSHPFGTLLVIALMIVVFLYAAMSNPNSNPLLADHPIPHTKAVAALSPPPATTPIPVALDRDSNAQPTDGTYIADARELLGANLISEARHELKVGQAGLACRTTDQLNAVVQGAANGNEAEVSKVISADIASGECSNVADGTRVFVNDINAEHEMLMFSVRIAGTDRDVWMFAASFFDQGQTQ